MLNTPSFLMAFSVPRAGCSFAALTEQPTAYTVRRSSYGMTLDPNTAPQSTPSFTPCPRADRRCRMCIGSAGLESGIGSTNATRCGSPATPRLARKYLTSTHETSSDDHHQRAYGRHVESSPRTTESRECTGSPSNGSKETSTTVYWLRSRPSGIGNRPASWDRAPRPIIWKVSGSMSHTS